MQNPNEDTEWNSALRRFDILPPKEEKEITEDDLVKMVDQTVEEKTREKTIHDMTLDELAEREDDEDDRILEIIRQQRIAEMKKKQESEKFGDIREISADDYIEQVNKAGDDVWVVLHLYKSGIPLCTLINQHLVRLSKKFPATKFLKSVSTTCIANYPDKNLPTIFVYLGGEMKGQIVGPHMFGGMNLTLDALEWMLSKAGAVQSTLKSDPRLKGNISTAGGMNILSRSRKTVRDSDSDSDDD